MPRAAVWVSYTNKLCQRCMHARTCTTSAHAPVDEVEHRHEVVGLAAVHVVLELPRLPQPVAPLQGALCLFVCLFILKDRRWDE